jgi:hypothetical protein
MILTKRLLDDELMEVDLIMFMGGIPFALDPKEEKEIWYEVEILAENADIGGISTVIGEVMEASAKYKTGRFASIRGRGLGRLLHFLEKYCEEDIVNQIVSDWGSVLPSNQNYREYVEKLVASMEADGFLTLSDGRLFATYSWDGDTDIPTFEFFAQKAKSYRQRQLGLKEQAVKSANKAPIPRFEEEEIDIQWVG